ncbi:hypothetical protein GCM10022392_25100 [Mucilaginibacter panaciglaebae]|uniref:Uncharacterized protein n=1 Tax=Mucilaginibacter panaciglaebae TaxID=502331 RepID=A0ABP7WY09_9SPHI
MKGLLTRNRGSNKCLISVSGCAIAYYLMYHWLQAFSYRTNLPWWLFAETVGHVDYNVDNRKLPEH